MNEAELKTREAKERAQYAMKIADIEDKRKAQGLKPLVFGEKAKKRLTFNHKNELYVEKKKRKKLCEK
jgi:hypothetical protein